MLITYIGRVEDWKHRLNENSSNEGCIYATISDDIPTFRINFCGGKLKMPFLQVDAYNFFDNYRMVTVPKSRFDKPTENIDAPHELLGRIKI